MIAVFNNVGGRGFDRHSIQQHNGQNAKHSEVSTKETKHLLAKLPLGLYLAFLDI